MSGQTRIQVQVEARAKRNPNATTSKMLFKLHYFFAGAGANAAGILLGVYMTEYTDATSAEIGLLYMIMPFVSLVTRPILCSKADRDQAHRKYLIIFQLLTALSYSPFVVIPFLDQEFHLAHPRLCWYSLIVFKIMGDIVGGGAFSMGDSLAINYAARIGTEFSTYRVWGTVSWMLFGFITGHLNEIWFLPKYAAGFIVLILAALCNALIYVLWPREYFEMVPLSKVRMDNRQQGTRANEKLSLTSKMTRSLMPRDVVWAHAKSQLLALVTFNAWPKASPTPETTEQISIQKQQNQQKQQQQPNDERPISRRVQIATLLVLLRRDPRILLYLLIFTLGGAVHMPMSFFFMQLSEICHTKNTCNFSELGGYVQISVASLESVLFVYIGGIVSKLGRLNSLTLTFGLAFSKFLFYATIWEDVDPFWSIASEMTTGLIFGTFLTFMVSMGHLFANEIEHIIPELIERGIVNERDGFSREMLKLSLGATMQALTSSAFDGLGRGLAAMAFGLVIDQYSYRALWTALAAGTSCVAVLIQASAMIERCLHLQLGFDHVQDTQMGKEPNLEMGRVSGKPSATIRSES